MLEKQILGKNFKHKRLKQAKAAKEIKDHSF
jgi:hypothetical protein